MIESVNISVKHSDIQVEAWEEFRRVDSLTVVQGKQLPAVSVQLVIHIS